MPTVTTDATVTEAAQHLAQLTATRDRAAQELQQAQAEEAAARQQYQAAEHARLLQAITEHKKGAARWQAAWCAPGWPMPGDPLQGGPGGVLPALAGAPGNAKVRIDRLAPARPGGRHSTVRQATGVQPGDSERGR